MVRRPLTAKQFIPIQIGEAFCHVHDCNVDGKRRKLENIKYTIRIPVLFPDQDEELDSDIAKNAVCVGQTHVPYIWSTSTTL